VTPGVMPLDVISIIMAVIVAIAAMQIAGGLDYLVDLADRILQAFRTRAFISVRGQMPITISIGVASDEAGGTEEIVRTLTARADEALYVAKRNGRDQAVLWQTGMRAFELSGARLSREMERLR